MRIDPAAEALGRNAIRWVGAREKEKFLEAVDRIADAEPHLAEEAVSTYLAVGALALRSVHRGAVPNQPQNQKMGEEILAHLSWDLVTLRDLYTLLEGVSAPEQNLQIHDRQGLLSVFIVAGYLVALYHRGLGYDDPYVFIDELLNTLVASPEA